MVLDVECSLEKTNMMIISTRLAYLCGFCSLGLRSLDYVVLDVLKSLAALQLHLPLGVLLSPMRASEKTAAFGSRSSFLCPPFSSSLPFPLSPSSSSFFFSLNLILSSSPHPTPLSLSDGLDFFL